MNLLTDEWIPVREGGRFRHMGLRELLCTEGERRLSLPRDDMEMAALQMLVCLTQVIFMPADSVELKSRADAPMKEAEYNDKIKPFLEWFDLDHEEYPFMQTRGVEAKEATPIQKLFVGLPEGNNHAFFNMVSEVRGACSSCVAVALFNQASNSPSLGGGFKGGLRGNAPITTLAMGDSIRETIWFNVIEKRALGVTFPWIESAEDRPVWVCHINSGEDIHAHEIGPLRGLFWQPIHIEMLAPIENEASCDICGVKGLPLYSGFNKERFKFKVLELWPHPHSPRYWKLSKGERTERFLSFTTTAPAWTRLNECIVKKDAEKQGHVPASVVTNYKNVFARGRPLHLALGGYHSDKASIIQRRHEVFTLAKEWNDNFARLHSFIETGMAVRVQLNKQLFHFGKFFKSDVLPKALSQGGSAVYYMRSEPLVHQTLREMNWREAKAARTAFKKELSGMACDIFDDVTGPYIHDPKMLSAAVVCRCNLISGLNKID